MAEDTSTPAISSWFSLAAVLHEWESDQDFKMRIRLVSFSNRAKPSASIWRQVSFLSGLFWCSFLIFNWPPSWMHICTIIYSAKWDSLPASHFLAFLITSPFVLSFKLLNFMLFHPPTPHALFPLPLRVYLRCRRLLIVSHAADGADWLELISGVGSGEAGTEPSRLTVSQQSAIRRAGWDGAFLLAHHC